MKKLFNIITLSFAFAPALYGDVVRESVNTLKKQIETADAQAFEKSCTALLESEMTAQEHHDSLAELAQHAQKIKQQKQNELANMGGATTKKTTVAKGIAQTIGGGILGIGTVSLFGFLIENRVSSFIRRSPLAWTEEIYWPTLRKTSRIARYLGFDACEEVKIADVVTSQGRTPIFSTHLALDNPSFKGIALAHTIIVGSLSGLALKYALQNFKIGWNYKAYLEQQIASLDEIIACIQQERIQPS